MHACSPHADQSESYACTKAEEVPQQIWSSLKGDLQFRGILGLLLQRLDAFVQQAQTIIQVTSHYWPFTP